MLKLAWRRPQSTVQTNAPADVVATLVADHLASHDELHWRARGRSMQPAIRHDDIVRLRPACEVRIGDVVLAHARSNQVLVLHRVRAIDGEELALRGDACRLTDPPVTRADVLAVADPCLPESRVAYIYRLLP
jgi:hypothetical protein